MEIRSVFNFSRRDRSRIEELVFSRICSKYTYTYKSYNISYIIIYAHIEVYPSITRNTYTLQYMAWLRAYTVPVCIVSVKNLLSLYWRGMQVVQAAILNWIDES